MPLSPEHRAAVSAGDRRWWDEATDDQRAARPYPQGPWPTSWTSIEVKVAAELDRLGEVYEHEPRILQWKPDFYLPARKLLIECDGTYWHARPDMAAKDVRKDAVLRGRGYTLVRLDEGDIHRDVVLAVRGSSRPGAGRSPPVR